MKTEYTGICPTCNGTGHDKEKDMPCHPCGGTGILKPKSTTKNESATRP